MNELPHKFQMRTNGFPGFTHTVKLNKWGDYEVTWARGFDRMSYCIDGSIPNKTFDAGEVTKFVRNCEWVIVEYKPMVEDVLPDEFYFLNSLDEHFKAQRQQSYWLLTSQEHGRTVSVSEDQVKSALKTSWKILTKPILTAEQQRQVKAFREQIDQLSNSIRIQEQTVEHHTRMIANYLARQDDLHEKIAELTGEDSPKIVKAKEMKAELDKLKKGNV